MCLQDFHIGLVSALVVVMLNVVVVLISLLFFTVCVRLYIHAGYYYRAASHESNVITISNAFSITLQSQVQFLLGCCCRCVGIALKVTERVAHVSRDAQYICCSLVMHVDRDCCSDCCSLVMHIDRDFVSRDAQHICFATLCCLIKHGLVAAQPGSATRASGGLLRSRGLFFLS